MGSEALTSMKASMFNKIIYNKDTSELMLYNSFFGTDSLIKIIQPEISRKVMNILANDTWILKDTPEEDMLVQYGYLVPQNLDEKKERNKRIRSISMDDAFVLTIIPTTECNFNCTYCYEEFHATKLSVDKQATLIEFVRKKIKESKFMLVNWFGGEPLEAVEIIKSLSKEFINICKKEKKVYLATITTNGYNLDYDMFKNLMNLRIIDYQITLDGTPEIHNKLRPLKNGCKTYDKIVQNLVEISQRSKSRIFSITVRTNFIRDSSNQVNEIVEEFHKLFGNDKRFLFSIKYVKNWGGNRINSLNDCILSEAECNKVLDSYISNPIKLNLDGYLSSLNYKSSICNAARKNGLVINADGQIYKCTNGFDCPVGSIDSEVSIDEKILKEWMYNEIPEKCDNCYFSGSCLGLTCPKARKENKLVDMCPYEKVNFNKIMSLINMKNFKIM